METGAAWEAHAAEWLAWTNPANVRDGFWGTTWPVLKALLPPPRGLTLDIGCGEGRGARELTSLGHRVVGVDKSPILARAARQGGTTTLLGDAARLPIASHSVSLAFACMSLLDIDGLDSAISEIDRVLAPTGVVLAAIVHPSVSMFDPARMRNGDLQLPSPYLTQRIVTDRVERDGSTMTFISHHRPLSDYLGPLFAKGLAVTGLIEAGDGAMPWCLAFRAERS